MPGFLASGLLVVYCAIGITLADVADAFHRSEWLCAALFLVWPLVLPLLLLRKLLFTPFLRWVLR